MKHASEMKTQPIQEWMREASRDIQAYYREWGSMDGSCTNDYAKIIALHAPAHPDADEANANNEDHRTGADR